MAETGSPSFLSETWSPPPSIEEARARARERFKSRLSNGEQIGECGCGEVDEVVGAADGAPSECVIGVRFRDSGRVYYFRSTPEGADLGDWVVVATGRGEEAGQVIIAPHQVKVSQLQGSLSDVLRQLTRDDVDAMEARNRAAADAVRELGVRARSRQLGLKPISASYSYDGSILYLNFSVPDRERAPESAVLRDLATEMAKDLGCRVELRQVGPRDEARLLGGLGRCGRTLCCSSWLPVFPEISMSMAKNQDLPLNPSKVSGVCGRLLCCLSYENEQYRQMKAVMPKLGQPIETPGGPGVVVSLHLMKELVTVRLEDDSNEVTFRSEELGLSAPQKPANPPRMAAPVTPSSMTEVQPPVQGDEATPHADPGSGRRRRRRRSGRRGASSQ